MKKIRKGAIASARQCHLRQKRDKGIISKEEYEKAIKSKARINK